MTIQSEVEVKQVRLVQGTGSQIERAKASGEILDTDLVVQTDAPDFLTTDDIVSSVSASSTNSKAVGAKLFYDTCGNIEATINAIRGV